MKPTPAPLRFSRIFLFTIFTIANYVIPTWANAQISPQTARGSSFTTPQVRAELLAHAPEGVAGGNGAGAGKTVWVGLQLAHKPEWHTYWKNSGDSGLPTTLQWTLPEGDRKSVV